MPTPTDRQSLEIARDLLRAALVPLREARATTALYAAETALAEIDMLLRSGEPVPAPPARPQTVPAWPARRS